MNPTRLPFTLTMLALLAGFGVFGRAHVGELDPAIRSGAGLSTRLLLEGQLHRVLTSVFFTAGGWQFYASLAMLAGAVGCVEWRHGARRAVLAFFGVHLATVLILTMGVALPLAALESAHGSLLYTARDVGPSAGYYGCLGLAIIGIARPGSHIAIGLIAAVLLARLGSSAIHLPEQGRTLSADLAHLIAFPLGACLGLRWKT